MEYQAKEYWEQLLGRVPDLRGVSHPDLSMRAAEASYRQQAHAVDRLLDRHGITPAAVLDVGSGTGFWLDFWTRRGAAALTSMELTRGASDRLELAFPGVDVHQGDVSDGVPPGRYDAVSAMNVLLHIVDDERWRLAVANLAGAVAPGGWLVLMEPVARGVSRLPTVTAESNSRTRSLEDYRDVLDANGCDVVELVAATVLQANPVDARRQWQQQALVRWWWHYGRITRLRPPVGPAVVTAVSVADRALTRWTRAAPTSKLLLARRR